MSEPIIEYAGVNFKLAKDVFTGTPLGDVWC